MEIKEIALRIGEEADEYADAKLQSKGEFHPDWHTVRDEYFAEALIAEIAKQNEPVAFANEELDWKGWKSECVVKLTRKRQSKYGFTIPIYTLYTIPPTAEQIANETAWQPIETAPKDEDLIVTDGNNVALGRWVGRYFAWGYGADPTHWMPLPTPPKRSMEGV